MQSIFHFLICCHLFSLLWLLNIAVFTSFFAIMTPITRCDDFILTFIVCFCFELVSNCSFLLCYIVFVVVVVLNWVIFQSNLVIFHWLHGKILKWFKVDMLLFVLLFCFVLISNSFSVLLDMPSLVVMFLSFTVATTAFSLFFWFFNACCSDVLFAFVLN